MKHFLSGSIVLMTIIIGIMLSFYYKGIVQYRNDYATAQSEVSVLIDKVIDSRKLDKVAMDDFSLAISALSVPFEIDIRREVLVKNPKMVAGEWTTESTYVVSKQRENWKQGDIITVTLTPKGNNYLLSMSSMIFGSSRNTQTIRIAGRVR